MRNERGVINPRDAIFWLKSHLLWRESRVSWVGQKIVATHLRPIQEDPGVVGTSEDFVTGLQGPVALAEGPDGALYIGDVLASSIIKVVYVGVD